MQNFGSYLGIVVSLVTILTSLTTLLAKLSEKKKNIVIVSFMAAVILFGVYLSTSTTITPHAPTNPFAIATPTKIAKEPPTTMLPTSTPILQKYTTGTTLYPNKSLTCTCNDPVVMKVTQIDIQPQQQRMLWTLTFFNSSQTYADAYFNRIALQQGNQINNLAPAEPTFTPTGQAANSDVPLQPNQTQTVSITFSFVPFKGMTYTLTGNLHDSITEGVTFDPTLFTL